MMIRAIDFAPAPSMCVPMTCKKRSVPDTYFTEGVHPAVATSRVPQRRNRSQQG